MWLAYPEDLEVDLWEYFRIDLREMWQGRLTIRRAALFASRLPPGARCRGEVTREEFRLLELWNAQTGEEHPRFTDLVRPMRIAEAERKRNLLHNRTKQDAERKRRLSGAA